MGSYYKSLLPSLSNLKTRLMGPDEGPWQVVFAGCLPNQVQLTLSAMFERQAFDFETWCAVLVGLLLSQLSCQSRAVNLRFSSPGSPPKL